MIYSQLAGLIPEFWQYVFVKEVFVKVFVAGVIKGRHTLYPTIPIHTKLAKYLIKHALDRL